VLEKTCVGVSAVEVDPSPKSHNQETASLVVSVNVTGNGGQIPTSAINSGRIPSTITVWKLV
jgi:hypothetical protein